jgi:hypothetical protein
MRGCGVTCRLVPKGAISASLGRSCISRPQSPLLFLHLPRHWLVAARSGWGGDLSQNVCPSDCANAGIDANERKGCRQFAQLSAAVWSIAVIALRMQIYRDVQLARIRGFLQKWRRFWRGDGALYRGSLQSSLLLEAAAVEDTTTSAALTGDPGGRWADGVGGGAEAATQAAPDAGGTMVAPVYPGRW